MASTSWSFGDGTTASGTDVSHVFAAAGSYEVTVTSTDSLGDSSSEKRTVVVSGADGSGGGAGGGPDGGGSGTVPSVGGAQRKTAGGVPGGSVPAFRVGGAAQRRLRGCLSRAGSHLATRIDRAHHDGASGYRFLRYSKNCGCMHYQGSTEPID